MAFSEGKAPEPDKLEQRFSFSGKLRGADVLRRLVEVCGYDLLNQRLAEWEASAQPPGLTPKEPCDGCDEEKERKAEDAPDIPVLSRKPSKPKPKSKSKKVQEVA